ncbi:Endothelial cell-specific molecule 1 [Branchiostoma belcheri]|nr:Endothelial cell-specific molecule 1 [Branchiostoma belcheri]
MIGLRPLGVMCLLFGIAFFCIVRGTASFNTTVFVPENATVGTAVARHNTSLQLAWAYILVDGNDYERFSIAESQGVVEVANPLDYQIQSTYQLQILIANEHNFTENTTLWNLTVHVLDVSGYPPYYNKTCETPERTSGVPRLVEFTDYSVDVSTSIGIKVKDSGHILHMKRLAPSPYGSTNGTFQVAFKLAGCPHGKYGAFCDKNCTCKNEARCHGFNGACLCAPGWKGVACDIPTPAVAIDVLPEGNIGTPDGQILERSYVLEVMNCPPGLHGERCDRPCDCLHNVGCDRWTGCVCEAGWTGPTCDTPCPAGTFGTNCEPCRCENGAECSPFNGTCICPPDLTGKYCESLKPREALVPWERDPQYLTLGELVGLGTFGHVLEGTFQQQGELPVRVAVKSLNLNVNQDDVYADFYQNLTRLRDDIDAVNWATLLRFAVDVSKALQELERVRIVHRDVAARNVVITDQMVAKLADFGLARDVYTNTVYERTNQHGRDELLPLKWMALETLRDGEYTCQSDVWSFGVMLWEIASLGEEPRYPGPFRPDCCKMVKMLRRGIRMEKPEGCSITADLYRLMCQCWYEVPDDRPTAHQLEERLLILIKTIEDGVQADYRVDQAEVIISDLCENVEDGVQVDDGLDHCVWETTV